MKKRILSLMLVFTLIMTLLAACSSKTTAAPTATPTAVAPAQTVKFTDSSGRAVIVPAKITRIAASGQLAQIVLFSLAPDYLVGLSTAWADSAKPYIDSKYLKLPVIGQLYGGGGTLNLEQLAASAPQVIIDIGDAKSTMVADMDGLQKQVGIPTIHIDATLTTMAEAYRQLGKLLGLQDKAEELAKYCESDYKRTKEIMAQIGANGKVKVAYCIGANGLSVTAKGSYHAEIIDLLSDNVAVLNNPSAKGTGNQIDMEQLLKWNPDVIIFSTGSAFKTVGTDPTWNKLSAIKSGKYYEVPEGPYNWLGFPPAINSYLGMIWMAQLLYPNMAKYSMYDEAAKFYKLFYHTDLTKEQYNTLTANSLGKIK